MLKAVVFDIDGTLYRQPPLRRAMLRRLLIAHIGNPMRGWRTLSTLSAYRSAQEDLRASGVSGNIAEAQITRTCERTHASRDEVIECVTHWMDREPLAFLARCVQPGLREFLTACRKRDLRLAALSDYPAEAKLEALGVSSFFDVVLCAQDPAVNCFKPNPRGLLTAIGRLGSTPSESLYVGDRLDVDLPTAEAAGTGCAIVTRYRGSGVKGGPFLVADYYGLQAVLWANSPLFPVFPTRA